MCFKGQACQPAPHRGDRDGICRLMRHHAGSRSSSEEMEGWQRQQLDLGALSENRQPWAGYNCQPLPTTS